MEVDERLEDIAVIEEDLLQMLGDDLFTNGHAYDAARRTKELSLAMAHYYAQGERLQPVHQQLLTEYIEPFNVLFNEHGDISTDVTYTPPPFASNWSFASSITPEQRWDPSFARSVDRKDMMFLVGPIHSAYTVQVSLSVLQQRADVLARALKEKTIKGYAANNLRWIDFCDANNVPFEQRMPADPLLVLDYLRTLAYYNLQVDTIAKHFTSLNWWHALHGYEIHLNKRQWEMTKRGLKLTAPPKVPPKKPVLLSDLKLVVNAWDDTIPIEANLIACALVSFFGMRRRCEVTQTTLSSFNPLLRVSRRHLKRHEARGKKPYYVLTIPFDKVNGIDGREVTIVTVDPDPKLDPVAALDTHLFVNEFEDPDAPLFSSIPLDPASFPTPWYPLTASYFTRRTNEALHAAGRSSVTGHSYRIGGATYYLQLGTPPDHVKVAGGWKSDAFLRYWRELTSIALVFLNEAAERAQEQLEEELAAAELAMRAEGTETSHRKRRK